VSAPGRVLWASRRRRLAAADDARRRLEARLREGPQRRLDELARTLPADGGEHLERARLQLIRTLDDLRELARGLHPRDLAQSGLPGALATLGERAPVPVELEVSPGRLPAEIEATVYFVCAEALANVAKYAAASRVRIGVTTTDGRVRVVVADDGRGGADRGRGTGLQGLLDRVEAVGGTLDVTSPAGAGTRLAADIPLGGEAH
jgi:signal transduction histidine kinase